MYDFQVIHKKGVENAVADWLSRDLVINAIGKEAAEEPFALRYIRDWAERGPEIPPVRRVSKESAASTNRPAELPEADEIINDKKRQIIFRSKQNPGFETRASEYDGLSTILVRIPTAADDGE